jgi:hypothetical protein
VFRADNTGRSIDATVAAAEALLAQRPHRRV